MSSPLIPTIVIDSREKLPWIFSPRVRTCAAALPAGDYSLLGFESSIAIERKSREDFVNTLGGGRERFLAELRKLEGYEFAAVVVESDLQPIVEGRFFSGMNPEAILGSVAMVVADFRVPVFFCSNRAAAQAFSEKLLARLALRLAGR